MTPHVLTVGQACFTGFELVRVSTKPRRLDGIVGLCNISSGPFNTGTTVDEFISKISNLVVLDSNRYHSYVAKALHNTFTQLRINSTISKSVPSGTNSTYIIFATANLSLDLPKHYISYNFEQLTTNKTWTQQFWNRLSAAQMVWDYSLENMKVLNAHCIHNTYHVPLGYDETMESSSPAPAHRDVDVVFAGAKNKKRWAKLAQLLGPVAPNGPNLNTNFQGAWGASLMALYKRSKVALNLHFYDGRTILEVHRIIPIIISKTLVLSEPSDDQFLDDTFQNLVNFTTGDSIRQSVISMINMDIEHVAELRYKLLLQCCRYMTYVKELLLQPYPRCKRH